MQCGAVQCSAATDALMVWICACAVLLFLSTRWLQWIVYLEGGGWCYDLDQCVGRAQTDLGSSKNYPAFFDPGYEGGNGMLSNVSALNPDFWGWNFVYVRYCDGASYTGDVAKPVVHNQYPLYFRGRHNFNAVISALMERGLQNAEEAILAGCSAGGLGTYVHCDHFTELLVRLDLPFTLSHLCSNHRLTVCCVHAFAFRAVSRRRVCRMRVSSLMYRVRGRRAVKKWSSARIIRACSLCKIQPQVLHRRVSVPYRPMNSGNVSSLNTQ